MYDANKVSLAVEWINKIYERTTEDEVKIFSQVKNRNGNTV